MTKRVVWSVMLLVMVALTGCASTAPKASEHLVEPLDAYSFGYSPLWVRELAVPRGAKLSTIEHLGEQLVLIESPSNIVTVVNVANGEVVWRKIIATGRDRLIGVSTRGEELILNSEHSVYRVEKNTGELITHLPLEQAVTSAPVVYKDTLVFGGVRGRVYSVVAESGQVRWRYDLVNAIPMKPALFANTVFAADQSGVMAMLDADSGELLWRRQPADGLTGQPAITATAVFVPTIDNKLYALNRATGRDRWIYRTPLAVSEGPIALGALLLQPLQRRTIWVALNAIDGSEMWRLEQPNIRQIIRTGSTLTAAGGTRLLSIDPQTGAVLKDLSTKPIQAVVSVNESLLIVSTKGRLMRLDPLK